MSKADKLDIQALKFQNWAFLRGVGLKKKDNGKTKFDQSEGRIFL